MSIYPTQSYVYAYMREDGTPYYIGKGKGNRAYHSKAHTIKPPQDKTRIYIIEDNLTDEQSIELEKYYIQYFGRIDNNTGILRNMTNGGDGQSGRIVKQSQKDKLRETLLLKKVLEKTS